MSLFKKPFLKGFKRALIGGSLSLVITGFPGVTNSLYAQSTDEPVDLSVHSTGYLPPSEKDIEWSRDHLIKTERVLPNDRALKLHNKMRDRIRLRKLLKEEIEIAQPGSEILGAPAQQFPYSTESVIEPANLVVPDAVDNSTEPYFPGIRDQGSSNACAAYSTNLMFTYMTGKARNWSSPQAQFSPAFTYSIVNLDNQGSPVDANIAILCENGCMLESEFPSNAQNMISWSTNTTYWKNALNYRADQAGYIEFWPQYDSRWMPQLKQMLANGYILAMSTTMSWNYMQLKNDPNTPYDDAWVNQYVCYANAGTYGVAHSMAIVGYNDNLWIDINGNNVVDAGEKGAFKLANSWGTGWGNQGFMWFAYDAIYQTSRVANAPSLQNRNAGWMNGGLYWMTARSNYKPKVIAELTISTAQRRELNVTIGVGHQYSSSPDYTFIPKFLNENYVNTSFNGSTSTSTCYPVVDFTELFEKYSTSISPTLSWYVNIADNTPGNQTQLLNFKLCDIQSSNQYTTAAGLPYTVDNSSYLSRLVYAPGVRGSNYPPVIAVDTFIIVNSGLTNTIIASTRDDGLPVGSNLTIQWEKLAGPGNVTFSNVNINNATFTFTESGVYDLEITADDGQYQTSKIVKVSVINAIGSTYRNYSSYDLVTNKAVIAGNYLYEASDRKWRILDISNPASPNLTFSTEGFVSIYGIESYGNYLYMLDMGLAVWDVSNKYNPYFVNRDFSVSGYGYNHMIVDNGYLVVSKESDIQIFSLANPAQPQLVSTYTANGTVRNIKITGNNLLISGYEFWEIVNITNKSNPYSVKRIDYQDLCAQDGIISGSYVYLSTRNGLMVYNISNISSPVLIANKAVELPLLADQITISGTNLYLGAWSSQYSGAIVFDISTPSNPLIVKTFALPGISNYWGHVVPVAILGDYFYFAMNNSFIVNKSFPTRKMNSNVSSINFGGVQVGNSSTTNVTLTNSGTGAISINSISFNNSFFTSTFITPMTLNPGYSVNVPVTFRPTATTTYTGKLLINSNAHDNAVISVNLSGVGSNNNTPPTVATSASVSANPVNGTTVNVSVLGADNAGEANLTYTWAAINNPPAGVSFSVNGTNSAKNSVATFSKSGSYTLQATIKDQGNLTVTSSVNVTVNQKLTAISVTPTGITINVNQTQQFSADARDQFGFSMTTQPTLTWSVTAGGTINSSGLYTAGTVVRGPDTVKAVSGTVIGRATVTVMTSSDVVYSFDDIPSLQDVNGIHNGIDFGTGKWVGGANLYNLTKCGYFKTGSSQTFIIPAGKVLKSIKVSTNGGCSFWVKDGVNPDLSCWTANQIPNVITTNWTMGASTITIESACGADLKIDDITYTNATGNTVYSFNDLVGGYQAINGVHGGIDFGSNKWAGGDDMYGLTKCAYFKTSSMTSQTFVLPAGKVLKSIKVSTNGGCSFWVKDGVNTNLSCWVANQIPSVITTNWTKAGSTITIESACGQDLRIDDITYGNP